MHACIHIYRYTYIYLRLSALACAFGADTAAAQEDERSDSCRPRLAPRDCGDGLRQEAFPVIEIDAWARDGKGQERKGGPGRGGKEKLET
eukprot:6743386-Pyramimonas_sp.AAC.1